MLCRRPRRLGGGKGGESRLVPRPPKDLKRQFVARLVDRALAEKCAGEPRAAALHAVQCNSQIMLTHAELLLAGGHGHNADRAGSVPCARSQSAMNKGETGNGGRNASGSAAGNASTMCSFLACVQVAAMHKADFLTHALGVHADGQVQGAGPRRQRQGL